MSEEIIIGIKTSTTLTPIPVSVGLHELLDYEWDIFLERETKIWEENLKLIANRTKGEECCADQFALMKSLQGLLGQRLMGIIQVELSWQVWNAPEEARVDIGIKNQHIHQGPYLHYRSAPFKADTSYNPNVVSIEDFSTALEPQSYRLAMNQPHEGSLLWTVNDHAPAIGKELGDYIEFVVGIYSQQGRQGSGEADRKILASESVVVLMPRARP